MNLVRGEIRNDWSVKHSFSSVIKLNFHNINKYWNPKFSHNKYIRRINQIIIITIDASKSFVDYFMNYFEDKY